jgi:acyl transferase domain-containing protein
VTPALAAGGVSPRDSAPASSIDFLAIRLEGEARDGKRERRLARKRKAEYGQRKRRERSLRAGRRSRCAEKGRDAARCGAPRRYRRRELHATRATGLAELWSLLLDGKDAITDAWEARWRLPAYRAAAGGRFVKWAGLMRGIDEFDPLFFKISPREAQIMDPQQRLLLTHCWQALEDSGHAARELDDAPVGVFLAVANSGYPSLLSAAGVDTDRYSAAGGSVSTAPNRISYFFNLRGPSEAINAACASSLVAIHRGVDAIRSGVCEGAFVGGINSLLCVATHRGFCEAGVLSEDGLCKTFSDRANGYVRGEGVGVLYLKRFDAARRDGDRIYAVIRGSAVGHGGRAISFSAPDPRSQADVISAAVLMRRRSGVHHVRRNSRYRHAACIRWR